MSKPKAKPKDPQPTPSRAEMEADVSIPNATPDELLRAAINFNPSKNARAR